MILLVTNKRDITIDFVVLELQRRKVPYFRLNTEDVTNLEIRVPGGDVEGLTFEQGGRGWCLRDIKSAYYRRPIPPSIRQDVEVSVRNYLMDEWSAIYRSIWAALEGRWLNSPNSIQLAENKPRQLAIAQRIGFKVPETLITNSYEAATQFASRAPTVGKPLRHALLEDEGGPGRVIFTSRISSSDMRPEEISLVPMILQHEVRKRADIRVTVVDDQVMATAIHSQCHDETRVDWRKGSRLDIAHEPIKLPSSLHEACMEMTSAMDLRFSAIDLIEDERGDFWFLEANPNGQWAWIEQRTGYPITSAIVDALLA